MSNNVRVFFQKHTLISIYTLVILLLTTGILATTGFKHIPKILTFAAALYFAYVGFHYLKLRVKLTRYFEKIKNFFGAKDTGVLIYILVGGLISYIIYHLVYLGGSPAIEAIGLSDNIEIAQLRRSITADNPKWMNYMSSFLLRAFIPFSILYFFVRDKKLWYWIILFIGCFYAFSLMQKSFIVSIMVPVLIYGIIKKKHWFTLVHISCIVVIIYSLVNISNPDIAESHTDNIVLQEEQLPTASILSDSDHVQVEETNGIADKIATFSRGLFNRVFITPGKTASMWFDLVPEKAPFLNGDGYRFIAKIKGSEYHNYFAELYPLMYPEYAKRGLKGSVNTASFVADYANFGIVGLILSGIILGLFLIFLESLFGNDFALKMGLNFYSIMIISSTLLTTTLLSGGWFLLLVMYLVLFNRPSKIRA